MRTSIRGALLVAVLSGVVGWSFGPGAHAQEQPPPAVWSGAVNAFAAAVNTWDVAGLQACTTPEFHARLIAKGPGQCRLQPDGLLQNGASLRADYAVIQVLCTHPDGVEEFVAVTAKQTPAGWRVCGGFTPGR